MDSGHDITRLIAAWQRGDAAAEGQLFERLYLRLHSIADHLVRNERANQTLGATALVHEAYVRFAKSDDLNIVDRQHFLALCARVMRRILVDRARAKRAVKRAAEVQPLTDDLSSWFQSTADIDEVISVDRALEVLSTQSPRQCQLVELRFFGGFSLEETAAALKISSRHVRREWDIARTRLKEAIDGLPPVEL